jgi:hypothetical protein
LCVAEIDGDVQVLRRAADGEAMIESGRLDAGGQAVAVRVADSGALRVYTRRLRYGQATAAWVVIALLAAMSSVTLGRHHAAAITVVCVLLALGLLFVARLVRRAIVVTPGWVTLRGLIRTRYLPAANVSRFEYPPRTFTSYGKGLRIVLVDGRVIYSGVFAPNQFDSKLAGVAETDELNSWLAQQGGSTVHVASLPDRRPEHGWSRGLRYGGIALAFVVSVLCVLVDVAVLNNPPMFGR